MTHERFIDPRQLLQKLDVFRADLKEFCEYEARHAGEGINSLHPRQMIRQRRLRQQCFPDTLFGEPAWDMLLELYVVDLEQGRISVSSLCLASAAPATTALRWLNMLVEEGLARREEDPNDRRRVWVKLSDDGRTRLRHYFNVLVSAA